MSRESESSVWYRVTHSQIAAYLLVVGAAFLSLSLFSYQNEKVAYTQCVERKQGREIVREIVVYVTTPSGGTAKEVEEAIKEFPPSLQEPITNLLDTFSQKTKKDNESFREFALEHLPLPNCTEVKPTWQPW